jgi:hypothetical protein
VERIIFLKVEPRLQELINFDPRVKTTDGVGIAPGGKMQTNGNRLTKAKRVVARMTTAEEIQELRKYLYERERILNNRKRQQQIQAKWEKIAGLPTGSRITVNLEGDPVLSRGTELEIDSRTARGRLIVKAPNGKKYRINAGNTDQFDLVPSTEFDPEDYYHPRLVSQL